eukprot:g2532.t1
MLQESQEKQFDQGTSTSSSQNVSPNTSAQLQKKSEESLALQEDLEFISDDLTEARKRISELENDIVELKKTSLAQKTDHQNELANQAKEHEALLAEKVTAMKTQSDTKETMLKDEATEKEKMYQKNILDREKQYQTNLSELQNKLKTKDEVITTKEKELQHNKIAYTELNELMNTRRRELKDLGLKFLETNKALMENKTRSVDLQKSLSETKAKLEESQTNLAKEIAKSAVIPDLQLANKDLQGELNHARESKQALLNSKIKMEARVKELESVLQQQAIQAFTQRQKQEEDRSNALDEMRQSNDDIVSSLKKEYAEKIATLMSEKERVQMESEEKLQSLKATLEASFHSQLKDHEETALQTLKETLQDTIESERDDADFRLRAEKKKLQAQFTELLAQASARREREVGEWEEKHNAIETKLENAQKDVSEKRTTIASLEKTLQETKQHTSDLNIQLEQWQTKANVTIPAELTSTLTTKFTSQLKQERKRQNHAENILRKYFMAHAIRMILAMLTSLDAKDTTANNNNVVTNQEQLLNNNTNGNDDPSNSTGGSVLRLDSFSSRLSFGSRSMSFTTTTTTNSGNNTIALPDLSQHIISYLLAIGREHEDIHASSLLFPIKLINEIKALKYLPGSISEETTTTKVSEISSETQNDPQEQGNGSNVVIESQETLKLFHKHFASELRNALRDLEREQKKKVEALKKKQQDEKKSILDKQRTRQVEHGVKEEKEDGNLTAKTTTKFIDEANKGTAKDYHRTRSRCESLIQEEISSKSMSLPPSEDASHSRLVADVLGYTNEKNPFNDPSLLTGFTWHKKKKSESKKKRSRRDIAATNNQGQPDHGHMNTTTTTNNHLPDNNMNSDSHDSQNNNLDSEVSHRVKLLKEAENLKRRRKEREEEKELMQKMREEADRERAFEDFADFEERNQQFNLKQEKQRAFIKIANLASGPCTTLARNPYLLRKQLLLDNGLDFVDNPHGGSDAVIHPDSVPNKNLKEKNKSSNEKTEQDKSNEKSDEHNNFRHTITVIERSSPRVVLEKIPLASIASVCRDVQTHSELSRMNCQIMSDLVRDLREKRRNHQHQASVDTDDDSGGLSIEKARTDILDLEEATTEYWTLIHAYLMYRARILTDAAQRQGIESSNHHSESSSGAGGQIEDIRNMLEGMNAQELSDLQEQVGTMLGPNNTDTGLDLEYWNAMQLHVTAARQLLRIESLHNTFLAKRQKQVAEILAKKGVHPSLATGTATLDDNFENTGDNTKSLHPHDTTSTGTELVSSSSHSLNKEQGGNELDRLMRERQALIEREKGSSSRKYASRTHGMGGTHPDNRRNESETDGSTVLSENDATEIQLPRGQEQAWMAKYKPRKPRFFNKVRTGYAWNSYNRTHYDQDNPPPKEVLGYRFFIFYPDLVDPLQTPTYKVENTADANFSIIRFIGGPPYEGLKRDPMLHGSDEASHRLWGFSSERIDINEEAFKKRKNFGKLTFTKAILKDVPKGPPNEKIACSIYLKPYEGPKASPRMSPRADKPPQWYSRLQSEKPHSNSAYYGHTNIFEHDYKPYQIPQHSEGSPVGRGRNEFKETVETEPLATLTYKNQVASLLYGDDYTNRVAQQKNVQLPRMGPRKPHRISTEIHHQSVHASRHERERFLRNVKKAKKEMVNEINDLFGKAKNPFLVGGRKDTNLATHSRLQAQPQREIKSSHIFGKQGITRMKI